MRYLLKLKEQNNRAFRYVTVNTICDFLIDKFERLMTGLLRSIFPRLAANTKVMAKNFTTRTIVVGELEVLHDPDKYKFFIVLDDTSKHSISSQK